MRLADIDKVKKDICTLYNSYKDRNPSEEDVMRVIDSQEVINPGQQVEKVKADLRNILDSYSTPHFIDAKEIDVEKFKEEMTKARLQVHPIEKQAAIYHGCHDCEHQPRPLMACDWLHHQTTIFVQCPRWKARIMPPEQCE